MKSAPTAGIRREDASIEEAKAQFETNSFWVLQVCRAALPVERKQRAGYILTACSMADVIDVPLQGLHSPSMFDLEGMVEASRLEVRPFGIQVVLIEPRGLVTSFPE